MVNNRIRSHIDVLVNYDFGDEEKHYEENDRPAGHVYESLKAVSEWLDGAYSEEELVALIEKKIEYEKSIDVSDMPEGMTEAQKTAMIRGMEYVIDIIKNPGAHDDGN